MSTPDVPIAQPSSSSGKKNVESKLHASELLVAIRPTIQKGYKCGLIILIQALLVLFFATIGIIEITLENRKISGMLCFNMASTFGLLWIIHFFGWRYNSPKILITHTIICALLGLSLILSVLLLMFSDLYNAVVMNLPPIRHQIQCGIIEAVVSVGLLTVFGAASWSRAEKGRAYSDARRRYMFAMKALVLDMPLSNFSILLVLTGLTALVSAQYNQFAEGIGYIGPTCAVVDGNLYIHGIIVRTLNASEIAEFENYQDAVSKLLKLRTSPPGDSKKPFMTQPIVSNFCYGLSDNTEVVLKGCIVRDNRVFIHGNLIRPLNSIEKDTISKLLTQRSRPQALFTQRKKRSAPEVGSATTSASVALSTPSGLKGVHNNVSRLLEQFLRVNSTIAKRFQPAAKMSSFFNDINKENAAQDDAKSESDDVHLRKIRTTSDSFLPADDYIPSSPQFSMPSFVYTGSIEQPFQQQLPQLTPLPTFNHGSNVEADFTGNNFNSYLQNQNQNVYGNINTFPVPTPIVSNSAYLVGSEEPVEVRGAIRQGEKYTIEGKNYVAVSMNELTPSQLTQIGQLYGNIYPGVEVGNGNGDNNQRSYGSFVGQSQITNTWQPYNPYQQAAVPESMSPFGQNFASQPKIRYHPGKESSIVTSNLSQETINAGMSMINQMPHHICSAHLSNPFWFFEKK